MQYSCLHCRDQEKDKVRIDSEQVAAILARVSLGIAVVYIDNMSSIIHAATDTSHFRLESHVIFMSKSSPSNLNMRLELSHCGSN